jgi:hypothetical protein
MEFLDWVTINFSRHCAVGLFFNTYVLKCFIKYDTQNTNVFKYKKHVYIWVAITHSSPRLPEPYSITRIIILITSSQLLSLLTSYFRSFLPILFTYIPPPQARNNPPPASSRCFLGGEALSSGKMNAVTHTGWQWACRRREDERGAVEITLTGLTSRSNDYYVISIEIISVTSSEGEIVYSDRPEMSLLYLLSKMPRAQEIWKFIIRLHTAYRYIYRQRYNIATLGVLKSSFERCLATAKHHTEQKLESIYRIM